MLKLPLLDRDDDIRVYAARLLGLAIAAVIILAAVIGAALIAGGPALAQTAVAAVPRSVDFGPLAYAAIEFVAPIVVSVGGTLGVWALARILGWLGLKQDALHRAAIEQGMDKAIGFAIQKVGDRAAGGIPIAVKSEAIATAAGYASRSFPKALGHFKKSSQDLADMIEARLEGVLIDPDHERTAGLRDAAIGRIRNEVVGT